MFLKEGETLEMVIIENLIRKLVECRSHLLVLHEREIVVVVKVGRFLGSYHLAHHLDGGIVLAAVFLSLA